MAAFGKRILLGALALWLVFVGARAVYLATLSPEERIRRRLAEMAEGFDATRAGPALSGFAPDLVVEPAGVSRDTLGRALAAFFLRENDPVAKRFAWRVRLPEATLSVALDPAGGAPEGGEPRRRPSAAVELTAHFDHSVGGEWREDDWVVRVEGRLEDHPDRGWVFVEARAETVSGRRPRY